MKKMIVMSLAFLGLSLGSLSAQTCCPGNAQKDCKPKVCCPSQTNSNCCSSDSKAEAQADKNNAEVKASATERQKVIARKTSAVAEVKK